MTDHTPATVVGKVKDERPEPGPFPDLYICTWWEWYTGSVVPLQNTWRPMKSMFHQPLADIEKEARELTATGHRNVRIIKIPGDATGGGQA